MRCIDDFDVMYDERFARQLKRRRPDNTQCKINTCSHTLKKMLEDQQWVDGMEDEDYRMFLNHLGEYFESRSSTRTDGDYGGAEDDADPDYKMFLENCREDGKSHLLKVAMDSEVSLSVKYAAEGGSDDEHEPPTRRKSRKVVDIKMMEAANDLGNFPVKDEIETQKSLGNVVREDMVDYTKNMRNCIGRERRNSQVEKNLRSEPVKHVSGKANALPSRKNSPNDNRSFEVESESEMEAGMVDECYETYLNWIKEDDDFVFSAIEDAKPLKYKGTDVESSSDSEVLVAYNASDFEEGIYRPFETSKLSVSLMEEDDRQFLGNPSSSSRSGYREKLMDKLREAYDAKEYEELWKDINERRPKERHFDFRGSGVTKSCKRRNDCGPSYLEQHIVLKRRIDAVLLDRCKVLNLLRGFFFWLENLVEKDAFAPWLDPQCSEVMPRNSPEEILSAERSGILHIGCV